LAENRKSVMAVTAAQATACQICSSRRHGEKLMTKHQTNAINTAATDSAVGTSKKVATELTEKQLDKVNGGYQRKAGKDQWDF
jgi:bacteriocin-like protein